MMGVVKELDAMLVLEVMSRELETRGYLSSHEMSMLREVAAFGKCMPPDLYLFLDAEVDVLYERIQARGRAIERHIELDYLAALRDRYISVLGRQSVPSLTIQTDRIDLRTPQGVLTVVEMIGDSALAKARSRSEF